METTAADFTSLAEDFASRLASVGGTTSLARGLDDVRTMIRELPGAGEEEPVWISRSADLEYPGLAGVLRDAHVAHQLPGSPAEVRDASLGISVARLAIAETGSVLLVEPDVADRSVSLMTQRLVVLCSERDLVRSLDDAASVLREIAASGRSYSTFVTGPSRTADIERELAVGVQGPGELHVVFLPAHLA